MAEALAFLLLRGVSIIAHLDDLLLFAASAVDLELTEDFLRGLGWLLNLKNSNLVPLQRITYLG